MNKKGIILTLCFFFLLSSFQAFGASRKDVLLVLDTSLSMAGHGGKNIMDSVKGSISRYIDQLEDGDRVTFITFDVKVKMYPTVLVDDENDKDIIKKYISITPAAGKWTNTYGMIQKVFEKAAELEKKDDSRQIQIVVMTDGIDDPSPEQRRKRLNIKEISKKYTDKDWWIYLVNFSDLKKNKKVSAEKEKLRKELKRVSDKSAIIEAGSDPELGIQEVKEYEKKNEGILIPLLIVLFIIGIVIIVLYFIKKQGELKVVGRLEYWNNELLNPFIENFDMTKYLNREIIIGNKTGAELHLREMEGRTAFHIKAVRGPNKDVVFQIDPGEGNVMEFKNREQDGFLQEGDVFQINNYTFKYFNS